jgi:serine protease Do
MKNTVLASIILTTTGLLTTGVAQEPKKPAPKITIDEFRAKLKKDDAPLPTGGQMAMTYAPVVDKILPTVVTIKTYGSERGQRFSGRNMEEVPPQMREFFRRWFGPEFDGRFRDENEPGNEDEDAPAPRGRNRREQEPSDQPNGTGSGFIISSDGYVLTNNHVVDGALKIEVLVTRDGETKPYEAKVIGTDPPTDVALLKIEATGLPQATIGDSDKLRVGDVVLAAGAPLELDHSVSQGIVSAVGRDNLGIIGRRVGRSYENFIQTDAAINMGNSGGPLSDALGRIIGINTAIFAGNGGLNGGIGFAIPISQALTVVEDLLDDGKVQRGFLGVMPVDVDKETAKVLGFPEPSGAVVTRVTPDSPAEKAGVEVGDVVVSAAGQKVDSGAKLRLVIGTQKPGVTVPLVVYRGKDKMTISVKLEALPDDMAAATPSGPGSPPTAPSKPAEIIAGVTVENVSPELIEKYELEKGITGVVVTKVEPDSSAAETGLQEGDVIQAVNRKDVKNLAEARALVKDKKETVILKVKRKGDAMLMVLKD